ncbi:LrgB family protein [Neisseria weaveri]|uniref:Protein LrgB n=1 Tax=Neisseria weaveri TaxID=28091 RepID=A0A3S4YQM2_9NEIS|nr:LrgB family protein [Neisseria weaveri]EGV36104.1 LrgB family protein [Neisseria weaveri ATCC 51223]EGV38722.1 LrgB family protein [Neisseria weaveri LMG 5135]SAY51475.1 protein LrgB [Neisseria weaveri]VEJ50549.1 protein LrgB [Neisseria weaveri]
MEMLSHPALLLFLTVTVYWITTVVRARTGNILCNPVVLSTVVVITYLKTFDIDYATYYKAGGMIDFWLKPAVVCLAVPLYVNWTKIRSQWLPIVASQAAGSLTGIITGVYIAKWMGADRDVVLSLAAKSVTNPIAIEITRAIGGIPAITAATVILAGMMGQMIGFKLLSASTIKTPTSQGISMGSASHAMGIAAALDRSRKFAAYASLGLIFNGVLTAALAPIIVPLLGI